MCWTGRVADRGRGEELLSAECVGSAGRAPAPQGVPDPTATIVRDHVAPDSGGRRRDLRVLPANRRSGQIRFTFIERLRNASEVIKPTRRILRKLDLAILIR